MTGTEILVSTKLWEVGTRLSREGGCALVMPLQWLPSFFCSCPDFNQTSQTLVCSQSFISALPYFEELPTAIIPSLSFSSFYIFLSVSVSFSVQSKWPFSVDTLLQGAGWAPSCLQPLSFHFASDSAFIPMHFKPCQ